MHNPFRQSDLNINSFGQNITIAGKLADKQTRKWVFIPTQTFHCYVHYMILSVTLLKPGKHEESRPPTPSNKRQRGQRCPHSPNPRSFPRWSTNSRCDRTHRSVRWNVSHIREIHFTCPWKMFGGKKKNCHSQSRKIKILHYQLRQLAACGASSSYWCNSCRQSPPHWK